MAELVALLDFGSNAARFLLTRIRPGAGFRVLVEERVQTRLGGGRGGGLPRVAVDEALRATHRFLSRVRNGSSPRVIAVATAAVRDAANRDRLLRGLECGEGVTVRVLSGREEARLGALAALRSLPIEEGTIADLGGASLQLSRVRRGRATAFASLPLGAVRLTRRFLHDDPATTRELRALRREIRARLLGALPAANPDAALVVLGGTIRTLARMHLARHPGLRKSRQGLRLPQSEVAALRERVEATTRAERRRLPGLKAERANIILAGAVLVEELMVFGGYRELTVCTLGVRDGLLLRETFDGGSVTVTESRFVNRELSWLEFNRRVFEEAQDPSVPLLERVKFLAIFSSNLDEFFMVRLAGLKRQVRLGDEAPGPDGLTPGETLAAVSGRIHELVKEQHRCFLEELQPLLAAEGVSLVRPKEATAEQERFLESYFRRTLLPVLTPLAIDPGHPFPHLANRSLCLVASIRPVVASALPHASVAVVHLPSQVLARFVPLPAATGRHAFMLLEDVIRLNLPALYHGYEVLSCHAIRVTRDSDIEVADGPQGDLMANIESGLRDRRMGSAVRLQYEPDLPDHILATLVDELELAPDDLYPGTGFTAFSDLFQLHAAVDLPRLKDRPLPPHPLPQFEGAPDVWSAIRAGDILAHHPYHSFDAVTRFVREAAVDPRVLAIKMTLYRVSPTSPIAQALSLAAENGKEVAVLVELRARFDEEANIRWARALEDVGAHVVYGIVGYKTHCKACLVVRQDADGIRRYCHLATGNYNVRTGGIYGDFGLFTCRETFGEDLTELFNLLTGYTRPRGFHHLLVAPAGLREGLVERIRREVAHARAGRPARIIAKMNSLVDRTLVEELYRASQAGVRIDLIVRGICCLRPGVPGLSENIRAVSIVDRFLEHARAFCFDNDGQPEHLLASADWMPRNLDNRVETAFPVLAPALQRQIREVLDVQLADTVKGRLIRPDGCSERLPAGGGVAVRSQERLYDLAGAPRPSA